MDLGALACLQHFVLTKCIFYLHFYVIYFLCRIVLYVLILEFFKNYVNKFRVLKNSSTRFSLRYLTVAAGDITVVRHWAIFAVIMHVFQRTGLGFLLFFFVYWCLTWSGCKMWQWICRSVIGATTFSKMALDGVPPAPFLPFPLPFPLLFSLMISLPLKIGTAWNLRVLPLEKYWRAFCMRFAQIYPTYLCHSCEQKCPFSIHAPNVFGRTWLIDWLSCGFTGTRDKIGLWGFDLHNGSSINATPKGTPFHRPFFLSHVHAISHRTWKFGLTRSSATTHRPCDALC